MLYSSTTYRIWVLTFSFVVFLVAASWQVMEEEDGPLFQDNKLLELRISLAIDSLQADRGKKASYHTAQLWDLSTSADAIAVKVKARGNFRRDPKNCIFPPLKMKFKGDNHLQSAFAYQKKLKLVTHCTEDAYVLKEYLLYKIYNLLSPYSFRVRLAEITYEDILGNYGAEKQFAFFIEDEKALAARHEGILIESGVKPEEMATQELLTLYLFEYMVGNLDWDVTLQKNLIVMGYGDGRLPVAVPYDFDLTGAVEAPYCERVLGEPVSKDNTRKFRKVCCSKAELAEAIAQFQAQQAAIFSLINDFPYLNKRQKNKLTRYLEDFFETLDNPEKVNTTFVIACKQN